jgi:shikimate dehydrogenase
VKINQHTSLYGVVGMPLAHSLSPLMHNAAFRELDLNAVYLAFESTNLEGTILGGRAMGIKGLSVTIPYKSRVIPFLDRMDPMARKIGAVNTVAREGSALVGYNTDAAGGLKALQEVTDPRGRRIVILGAGGAARAIGFILAENGARLTIANRSIQPGEDLAGDLGAAFVPLADVKGFETDILINATPVGMYPDEDHSPLDQETVRAEVVMDVIYNPLETRLLRMAKARGAVTVPGIRMFVFQGAEQFRLWTGLEAPLEVMENKVRQALDQAWQAERK